MSASSELPASAGAAVAPETVEVQTVEVQTVEVQTVAPETVEIAVVLPADLHARPAGRLTRTAARFSSTLLLQCGERTADPGGVLAVMALGATTGRTVIVRAQGDDAPEAAAALAEILATAR